MRGWLSAQADVLIDASSTGAISSFLMIKSGVGLIVTIAPFAIQCDELRPVFYEADTVLTASQISFALDPKVGSGLQVPAVIRLFLSTASAIGTDMHASAAIWVPARLISGFAYFAETAQRFAKGGAFPALALVGFDTNPQGEISTKGMQIFAGQEVRVMANDLDHNANMQRMVRILHDLVQNGPISQPMKERGLAPDEWICLTPSVSGEWLDIAIKSETAA
jgi:hypothetical protein